MKKTTILACVSLAALLSACGPSGYYDSRGNWHVDNVANDYDHPYNGYSGDDNYVVDHSAARGDSSKVAGYDHRLDPDHAPYHRVGFYDRNGYYITTENGPRIPHSYLPPRGMCRIWFLDRPAPEQPPVESCVGIQDRLPDGAYVVYGG